MKYLGLKLLAVAFIVFLTEKSSLAQFYMTGQEPASIKWEQINTPDFQLIFPADFEKEANHLANTLDYIYDHVDKSLAHKPKKISILLHSHSSHSNGLTTWAPKRIEMYTTPPQDNYAQDWLDQLAVHELRHVVQIDEMDKGVLEIFSLIFGQQFTGGLAGFLPGWLYEGDAVNNETALTSTGRGRDASFEMVMKALVTSDTGLFSYDKAVLGSYKDFVPNKYSLGYPLVAWTREKFSISGLDSARDFFGRYPTPVFSMPCGLPKLTGYCSRCLYKSAFADLKKRWDKQLSKIPSTSFYGWDKRPTRFFTSYQLPRLVNDTTLVAVKSGIDQLISVVLLYKNGSEKTLYTCGQYAVDQLSCSAGKFVLAEEIPDPRWANRSYFCIRIGDIATGKVHTLTKKTRLFAPTLSPDGKKIVAVQVSLKNEYSLVILDASTGNQEACIPIPGNQFPQLPVWSNDAKSIITVCTGIKGKSLQTYSLQHETWRQLIPPAFSDITLPADAGDYILFVGEYNGTNNIYGLLKKDNSIWQVTNVKYGAFAPNLSKDDQLVFSEYTSQGYRIESTPFNPAAFCPLSQVSDGSIKLYQASAKLEHFNFQDSIMPKKAYPITRYSKFGHLINIHSWAPFYFDYNKLSLENNNIAPGLSLLSQNILGTFISNFGYAYQNNTSYWSGNVSYQGWYPVVDFSVNYGGPVIITQPEGVNYHPQNNNTQLSLLTDVSIPFNFSRGRYITGFTPGFDLNYQNEWFFRPQQKNFINGITYAGFYLNAYSYSQTALRDINPKWGAVVNAKVTTTPGNNQINNIFYVLGRFYLPGIINHHSLILTTGYQEQSPGNYLFSTQINFPRGIASENTYKLSTLSVDYTFPLFYPDFPIPPVFYFKRIQGNLFYDIANNRYKDAHSIWHSDYLSSTGADLTTDFHFLRIAFPINSGIRMVYIPKSKTYTSEILFRIDLDNF